jgi:anaerobic selenocysteine-containing dehydrogenase
MVTQGQETLHKTTSSAMTEVKPTVCFWCKAECGLLAHVQDGRLLKLEEDPEWPIKCYPPTAGCVRRKAATEYLYHPGRVNYPLKRVGERGEGKWQRIEWKDALDEIAEKLDRLRDRYGGETLGASGGTARAGADLLWAAFDYGRCNRRDVPQLCIEQGFQMSAAIGR